MTILWQILLILFPRCPREAGHYEACLKIHMAMNGPPPAKRDGNHPCAPPPPPPEKSMSEALAEVDRSKPKEESFLSNLFFWHVPD